jgi:hypothetical protein
MPEIAAVKPCVSSNADSPSRLRSVTRRPRHQGRLAMPTGGAPHQSGPKLCAETGLAVTWVPNHAATAVRVLRRTAALQERAIPPGPGTPHRTSGATRESGSRGVDPAKFVIRDPSRSSPLVECSAPRKFKKRCANGYGLVAGDARWLSRVLSSTRFGEHQIGMQLAVGVHG